MNFVEIKYEKNWWDLKCGSTTESKRNYYLDVKFSCNINIKLMIIIWTVSNKKKNLEKYNSYKWLFLNKLMLEFGFGYSEIILPRYYIVRYIRKK